MTNEAQKHAAERCDPNDPAWEVTDAPPKARPMHESHVDSICGGLVKLLNIGPSSVSKSSMYADYGAVWFAVFTGPNFAINGATAEQHIERAFRKLCDDYGWTECRVTHDRSSVSVIFHQSPYISTNDKRMPY